jgi:hypothetical protein
VSRVALAGTFLAQCLQSGLPPIAGGAERGRSLAPRQTAQAHELAPKHRLDLKHSAFIFFHGVQFG